MAEEIYRKFLISEFEKEKFLGKFLKIINKYVIMHIENIRR
jgi:hypothetical protein